MKRVINWLSLPELENQIDTSLPRLLNYLLWIMMTTMIITRIIALALPTLVTNTNLVLIFFTPIFLICQWLLRHGSYKTVTWILVVTLSTVAISLTITTRGILSPYPMTLILPILLAGVTFGRSSSLLVTFAACAFVTLVLLVGLSDTSSSDELATNMVSNWLVFVTIYSMSIFIVLYAQTVIRRTLTQITESNQVLAAEINTRKQIEGELRASEEQFRMLIENSVSGSFMLQLSDGWRFIYVNPMIENIFGYTSAELLNGMRPQDLIHSDEHSKLERRMTEQLDGTYQFEPTRYRIRPKDGSEKRILTLSVPIVYQGKRVLIGTVVDITSEQEAEQSRIDLAAKQQQIEFLKDFIGTMTHDLKTPLNVINTSVYLAQKANEDDRRTVHLNKISKQIKYLTAIIDDILTIARLDTVPSLNFEPTNLNDLILSVMDQLQIRFDAKALVVTHDLAKNLPMVQVDPEEMTRALINLIENAANYTPEGKSIKVRSLYQADDVFIYIQDSGIGIPSEDLPYIFNRFRRASNAHSISRGTGLGLAIVDQIIKLHGASIHVSSNLGEGTEFSLQLNAFNNPLDM